MNNDSKFAIGLSCHICSKRESISESEENSFEELNTMSPFLRRGWVKREFCKDVSVWFCSYQCAFNSNLSRYMTKYWKEKNSVSGKVKSFFGFGIEGYNPEIEY